MKIEIERNSVGLYSIKAGNKLVHYKKSWQFVKGWPQYAVKHRNKK